MKKLFLLIVIGVMALTSCSLRKSLSSKKAEEGYIPQCHSMQNKLFSDFKDAINAADVSKIEALFSLAAQNNSDIKQSASDLINYIKNDIHHVSSDIGEVTFIYEGDTVILQQSTYFTDESKQEYKVAIRTCIENAESEENIGVLSFYIIKAEEHKSLTYLGDEKWTMGINIGK